jgi:tripeptide aminopeptidase
VLGLFMELAAIPSPPGSERLVAERTSEELRAIGLDVLEDDAGARVSSDTGNLLARVEPTCAGTPIVLCAHLDTVAPTGPIEPVVEDGVVRNAAGTILGADNKAAVAAMVEAVRQVVREGRETAGIELVLTVREETGCEGASAFDVEGLRGRAAFVYDHAAPIGDVVVAAPHQRKIDAVFRGRAAHAGINPEDGRSAIVAAARAVADLRLGRLDDETTANVGTIHGGTARNVVAERCALQIDTRSRSEPKLLELVQEILETLTFAATVTDCEVETRIDELYHGYRLEAGNPALALALDALERTGFSPRQVEVGGGADANIFNARGLPCVVLANGMANIHSPDEQIAIADLEAMVDVTLALVDAARDAGHAAAG